MFHPYSDNELKFIRSQKNKPQLVFRGYVYNKKTSYQNGNVVWRCADMSKFKCPASCMVNGTTLLRTRHTHNHESRKSTFHKKDVYLNEQELRDLLSASTSEYRNELEQVIITNVKPLQEQE